MAWGMIECGCEYVHHDFFSIRIGDRDVHVFPLEVFTSLCE